MALGIPTRRVALSTLGLTLVGGCVDLNLDWEPPREDGSSSDASAGDSDTSASATAGSTETASATDSGAGTDSTGDDSVGMTSTGVTGPPGTTDEPSATTEPQTEPATTGQGEEILYDFWLEHCEMEWVTGVAPEFMQISCNTSDPQQGWEQKQLNQDVVVDGGDVFGRALLLSPPVAVDGAISGRYAGVSVDVPSAFVAEVACKSGGGPCYAEWQFGVWEPGSMENLDFIFGFELDDGEITEVFYELTPFVGEDVDVSIAVTSFGGNPGDELVWESPRIIAL